MWWGEIYLILTLITAGAVAWKGDGHLLRALILVICQWCVYNFLHDSVSLWFSLSNQLVDIFILFFLYANWFFSRAPIFLSLGLVFIARIAWHMANAMFSSEDLHYAEGNNALYILELLCLWVAVLRNWR